ncbi:GNAT superfamily N-acetyltransferase [Natronobacillus azotifigens]|uniref:GNAT family N-acetyltransferase n=1 Tax=Natronobacillus azotifigens TaxID=472978 RepID=A0A9J6RFS5_9BACI|nr:GNAT family N-acetyltransferase [Natronobacillus azotifigens]MCZ0704618.1 GNAT family N-acetyltransferase [Natronobacillus azotifigens]
MFAYKKSTLRGNKHFWDSYLESLTSRYDNFLEEHILTSEIYSIYMEDEHIGYFGVFNKEMLTQFFISKSAFKFVQQAFQEVLNVFEIQSAFVPTCDESFLSLCLDKHSKVHLQAYFFEEAEEKVREPEFPRDLMKVATLDDLQEIVAITGDFVDNHEQRIKDQQLYVLRENNEFLGMGLIEDNVIMKNCQATGMFTNEKHRQKGIGRSIILNLKQICHENGKTPLPGCWYYNENSKRTLESSGYISKTRLLRIDF